MATLKQAKTEEQIKKLTVASVKKEYNNLAIDYNKLLNLDYIYCPCCGEFKAVSAFYTSNRTKSGIEHLGCKACILDMATDFDYKTKIRTDNKEKTIEIFRKLDLPFIESAYNSSLTTIADSTNEKNRGTAFQNLLVMVKSLPQWANLRFKDSEFGLDENDNPDYELKENKKTIKSGRKRFGNYSNEDLMFLESEYQDWITRYECNTKAQEAIFERLAFKKWEINKATREGKPTKDLDKTYTELLTTANVTPKQNVGNAFTESLTFGQMIEIWEKEKPILSPEPEFRDINKIGKLITLFKGALLRALSLDGGYNKEYDDYLEEYTVHKPEDISGEDSSASDDMYAKIFGSDGE